MKNARISFDKDTGSGDLYYRGQYICRVKFPEKMRKALAYEIDRPEVKQCAETTTN